MTLPLHRRYEAVVMGASAGAVEALSALLPALPEGFALPVAAVVHVPAHRESLLPDIFGAACRLRVKEAEDKEPLEPGSLYLAPPGYHLLVEPDRRLSLSTEEPVHYSRPSIDVLFETAADAYGAGLIGIVLTGASADGAQGLRRICEAGGLGIVQQPNTALAPRMPQAAWDACPSALPMTLEGIADFLIHLPEAP